MELVLRPDGALDIALVRGGLVLGPLAVGLGLLAARRPGDREKAGILFAMCWNLIGLMAVNTLAVHMGWWSFNVEGGLFLGVPVDLLVGWGLLWTVLGTLALPRWHPAVVVVVAVLAGLWIDWLLMPLAEPVVVLHERWLAGEAVALLTCLAPAALLARWTADDRRLGWRAALHVVMFGAAMLWILPAAIFAHLDGSWEVVVPRPGWLNMLLAQVVLLLAVPGLGAVQELCERGAGTPVPIDPPKRLVTSGPYAYLRNPMQVSMSMVLLGWGLFLESWWVTAAAGMAIVFGAGIGCWANDEALRRRFGRRWEAYRAETRVWWPTWRPARMSGVAPARLYLDLECRPCTELAQWLERRRPRGMEIVPASEHPRRLARMTYEAGPADDVACSCAGIVALARALDHVHLGWAFAGWILRLPVVRLIAQLLTDAVGGGRRER